MASHEPSLTVLTGPLAGRKLALGGNVDNILIGADPSCGFHLPTAGVSPIHARLWIDASGATVYDTNSPRGLYVNDDRVTGQATLHNGDILWLGTPGEEEAIMIQVVLPPPGQVAPTVAQAIPQELIGDTLNLPGAAGMAAEPEVVEVVDELPPATAVDEPTTFLQAPAFRENPPDLAPAPEEETAFLHLPEAPAPVVEETVAAEIPSFELPAEQAQPVPETTVEETVAAEIPSFETHAEETAFLQSPAVEETVAAEIPTFEAHAEETAFLQAAAAEETAAVEVPALEVPPTEEAPFLAPPEPDAFFVEPIVAEPVVEPETTAPEPEPVAPEPAPATILMAPSPVLSAPPSPRPLEPEPVRFEVELPRAPAAPLPFDDETESTMADEPIAAPATIVMASSPVVPLPAPAPVAPPAPAPAPPPAPKAAAPRAEAPAKAPAKSTPKPAPARPAPAPRPAARPTPAPMPAPVAAPPPAPPAARRSGPPVAALALGGVVVALLLAGGGFLGYRMMNAGPEAPPVTAAPATQPATPPPASVAEAPPSPEPEVAPPVEEGVTIVGQPTAKPAPPSGAPTAPPTTQPKGKPTPAPATTVPAVDPAALKAQQVAGLVGQGDAAVAAHSYEAAIGHYEEALKLDPENAKALAGKASAASLRDAAKKSFVTGRTVVIPAKQEKGGLAGFEGAAVQKAPDFSGRLEFAVSPGQVKPGDTIRIQVALTNDGKKTIKVSAVALAVNLNGKKTDVPFSTSAKEIEPGQKASLGEVPFTWPEGVTFWAAETTVSANKGDSLRAQVTWK